MEYRKLLTSEINNLEKQGCQSENWQIISVVKDFKPDWIRNVTFSGKVKLGLFDQSIEIYPGVFKPCGMYNSFIKDCQIESNVYINDVKNLVNYHIKNNTAIENVASLTVSGTTTFGNGTELEILNEGGGRELIIFDQLSSQIAYLMVTRRDDEKFVKKLTDIINKYAESQKNTLGTIGTNSRITNCQRIKNVNIGDYANIYDTLLLKEGTISSNEAAPATVGEGVIAKNFIILSGSKIDSGALLDRTFVGQGVKIGKQYSAENSAFFANCEGFHGEACSIFAGPYTVTHHKSTLLIAGLFSFYNAGSGSNQSNHMYKLGPVHQGILERGAKTGSFSYMMWPARVGAFSGVIGKHYANFDATDFPFSYILESKGQSMLMPAMNLYTVGTRRDSEKWPNRDRRKDLTKYDLINFELFNPYIIRKVLNAVEHLKDLESSSDANQEFVQFNDLAIKKSKISDAIDKYEMAVKIFIGDTLIKHLEAIIDDFSLKKFASIVGSGKDKFESESWMDVSGMIAPVTEINDFLSYVKNNINISISDILSKLNVINAEYSNFTWFWCLGLIQDRYNIDLTTISAQELIKFIEDWCKNKIKMNELILKDAEKEFSSKNQIGFGLDGDAEIREKDFYAVRGKFEDNKFVQGLKTEIAQINKKTDKLISVIKAAV